MPACSSCSSSFRAALTRLPPVGVRQLRCSQIVCPSSLRLSAGNMATVCWTSAICRRVKRRPKKVVDLRFSMRGSTIVAWKPIPSYHRKSGLGCQGVFPGDSENAVSAFESIHWRSAKKSEFRLRYFSAIGRTGGGGSGGSDPTFFAAGAPPGRVKGDRQNDTLYPPLSGVAPSTVIPGGKAAIAVTKPRSEH